MQVEILIHIPNTHFIFYTKFQVYAQLCAYFDISKKISWTRGCVGKLPYPIVILYLHNIQHCRKGADLADPQGFLQLQAWVSTKWSLINSFFSSLILIFHQYSVSKIHFYHAILQDSIRRHSGLELKLEGIWQTGFDEWENGQEFLQTRFLTIAFFGLYEPDGSIYFSSK